MVLESNTLALLVPLAIIALVALVFMLGDD